MDTDSKQESPVRDDLLDKNEKTEDISYQDKKKFWENMAKDSSEKPFDLSKKNLAEKTNLPPTPKPRFSHNVSETTAENIETDNVICTIEDSFTKNEVDTSEPTKTVICGDLSNKPEKNSKAVEEAEVSKEIYKSDSVDTDTDGLEDTSSQAGDNAGYISDSGDVEHYISDSEIEDRVPQIRERQMSVFIPPSVSQRTRYERSASLPTEDLYEVSARSTKLRKQYYEEQIKKEMIKEQLTIDLEDEGSPERKSIASPEMEEIPTNETDMILESELESEKNSRQDQETFPTSKDDTFEIHIDKSETEKSEKVKDIQSPETKIHFEVQDNIPEITFTLSGKQRRISEESDEYVVEEVEKISPVPEQEEHEIQDEKQELDTSVSKCSEVSVSIVEAVEYSQKNNDFEEKGVSDGNDFSNYNDFDPTTSSCEGIKHSVSHTQQIEMNEKTIIEKKKVSGIIDFEVSSNIKSDTQTIEYGSDDIADKKLPIFSAEEKKQTENILDDGITDIDLESEDLKNIVSRLESMHKFRKLKATSKLPVKKKETEKIVDSEEGFQKSENISYKVSEDKNQTDMEIICKSAEIVDSDGTFITGLRNDELEQSDSECFIRKIEKSESQISMDFVDDRKKQTDEKFESKTEIQIPSQIECILDYPKTQAEFKISTQDYTSRQIDTENEESKFVQVSGSEKSEQEPENQQNYTQDTLNHTSGLISSKIDCIDEEQFVVSRNIELIATISDLDDSKPLKNIQKETNAIVIETQPTEYIEKRKDGDAERELSSDEIEHHQKTKERIIPSDFATRAVDLRHSKEISSPESDIKSQTSSCDFTKINQPQENIENTIWEVSVESEMLKEEKLSTLQTPCPQASTDTKSDSISDKIIYDNSMEETNLESEKFDSDPSESLPSNNLEYNGHDDMKKIILESLHQQKVDPDEAKVIANSIIEEIELEIQKVENLNRGLSSKSQSLDSDNHVADYLKELAETKGLDQREVELVESVLERRQRQILKLSRGDTQASSMEITDEDLRYSESEYDYSNVLQQQMGQLEAEYSDHLKNVYDSLVEDQRRVSRDPPSTTKSGENANEKKGESEKDEQIRSDKSFMQKKDIILEEDENFTESLTDESENRIENVKTEELSKTTNEVINQSQSQIPEQNIELQQVEEQIIDDAAINIPIDSKESYIEVKDIFDLHTDEKSEEHSELCTQQASGHCNSNEMSKEIMKRTSSSDSKSSICSGRTPDEIYSTCSSSRKIDSDGTSEVIFRKSKKCDENSGKKVERKSGLDLETYSSSGESHYHSFEMDSKSRPCSSDVEGLLPTGSSEYESALNSQELSMRSQLTSGEYHTAISSLSSKESMMSIESESSGNLASIEVSETSETLVPTNSDLEGDIDIVDQQLLEDSEIWQTEVENLEHVEILSNVSSTPSTPKDGVDIPQKMKRSHEMTFQQEHTVLPNDSSQTEPNDIDEKFATSLDEGSVLSVSLSSTSSIQLRTVIELSRTESGGREESITSAFSDHISLDDSDILVKTPENVTFTDSSTSTNTELKGPIDSVTILSATINNNGITSVCSQVTTETMSQSSDSQRSSHDEFKKKGHRRQDSTSFIPTLIHGISKPSEPKIPANSDLSSVKNDQEPYSEKIEKETSEKSIDLPIRSNERRDSHGKSSSTSSEKSSFEEAEAEAAFNMVAHISPVHKIKQICPIIEDIDAEKIESEARENARRERIERAIQIRDASPGSIPDIKVTEHTAPLDETKFRYPELEIEREELERENKILQDSEESSIKEEKVEEVCTNESQVIEETHSIKDNFKEIRNEPTRKQTRDDQIKKEKNTVEKNSTEEERASDSPNSDSFELVEQPDIIDDFVVIEEIGKEASEMDSEGKSVTIQAKPKSQRKRDEEIDAYLARSDPTPLTKMTELKYFPDTELEFEFEDSPPQAKEDLKAKDYGSRYDQELEANRKWIEQQFHGDHAAMAAAGYGYEMEFERGPLEDIKEEDVNDIEASSRIGSLGSQKESGGSLGSIKDSYSSTPEYDVLAGRRYFTRSGDHDDISMSSLQEFENLEKAMSLETKKLYHGSGSQESFSNGSFRTRYYSNKGQGDDISVSSLKEFEGLEKACIAVYKTEVKVKEEEELLSQNEVVQEVVPSQTEKDSTNKNKPIESDEEDYEKRMFEIDEIIRQAQNNVERFTDLKEPEKTESLGRGDSIEEVSKVPDLDLDAPLHKSVDESALKDDDPMIASTDSLELEQNKLVQYGSTDSLDQKHAGGDIMTASTDSIEFNNQLSRNITSDSIENKTDGSNMVCSDSLDIAAAVSIRPQIDSLEEDEHKIIAADFSSSDTGKDFSSSVRDDADEQLHELMIGSTDSLEPTSSTATHATYQYETDSVFSGSFTSGGSNTMVSSTDTIDLNYIKNSVDISAAVRKVCFDEETSMSGTKITTEFFEESSIPYVTEVIEPSDDPTFSHTIHRRVQMPVEVRKVTFHGNDVDKQLEQFIKNFGENEEEVHETEEIDSAGNVHTRRIVQKRFVVRSENETPSLGTAIQTEGESLEKSRRVDMSPFELTTLTKAATGSFHIHENPLHVH